MARAPGRGSAGASASRPSISHFAAPTPPDAAAASTPESVFISASTRSGQVAGRRITAGQGNTVPQDATQNSFFDFMAEPWLLPKRGDHENKWLNIIGFDRRRDFAQPARPPIHPTFTPMRGHVPTMPIPFRNTRPPATGRVGADPQKPMIKNYLTSLALIGGKPSPGPLHRRRPPITHHPPPPRYNRSEEHTSELQSPCNLV